MAKSSLRLDSSFIIIGIIFGVLNSLTINIPIFSAVVAIVEYSIIIGLLIRKSFIEAFRYLLLFLGIVLEVGVFVHGDGKGPDMYNFIDLPLLHGYLLAFLIFYIYVRLKQQPHKIENVECRIIRKWLYVLYGLGAFSIFMSMLIDDNNIMETGNYPKLALVEIFYFFTRFFVFLSAIEMVQIPDAKYKLEVTCWSILAITVVMCILNTFVFRITGWYDTYEIMLSPLVIAFTPCLLMFCYKDSLQNRTLSFVLSIIIIASTFIYPTCIGSKWYIVIMLSIMGWLILLSGIKKFGWGVIAIFLVLIVIIANADLLLSVVGNDYVSWKLRQTLNLISFKGVGESGSFYDGLDHSTLYRFDELHNTFIEFSNKPFFALIGKGFAGTIKHTTNILSWETDPGAFSDIQVKMNLFYEMHESFAVIFLRHGLVGVFFIIYVVKNLFKRITNTPWAMIALLWFVFYWSYGMSMIIGSVAMIIALSTPIDSQFYKNKNL